MLNNLKLQFLYTNIGRGHPFYLDGINNELIRADQASLVRSSTDVFTQSGFMPRQVWNLAKFFYRSGSSGELLGKMYNHFRKSSDYNRPSALVRLAGRDITRYFGGDNSNPLIVAHPILVGILSGRPGLVYQHGELVAPDESLVKGADYVLVPTESVARRFLSIGYRPDRVIVTGLCIEPALARQAEDCFHKRKQRFPKDTPLTGALFSSGAEPVEHVKLLISCARSLIASGQKVILSVTAGGRLASEAKDLISSSQCTSTWIQAVAEIPQDLPALSVICNSGRKEEYSLIAQLFPHFDFFVAPPHERTNWAIGLGLPMFPLAPCYGSYAPLNLKLLLSSETSLPLENEEQASGFGEHVAQLRSEQALGKMAEAGWGRYPTNGFAMIASWFGETFAP